MEIIRKAGKKALLNSKSPQSTYIEGAGSHFSRSPTDLAQWIADLKMPEAAVGRVITTAAFLHLLFSSTSKGLLV